VDEAEAPKIDHSAATDKSAPTLRLVSAGGDEALARFDDPRLLAAGRVNLISLEAVHKRLGARWELRRDQVYQFVDRVLERGVGREGFFLRVSPTDYFVVHPDHSRVAGQAACLRYLREVLNHFLGEDQMAAAGILEVTRIAKGQLEARPVDVAVHAETEPEESGEANDIIVSPRATSAAANLDRWTPFFAADGRQLRVSAILEPVYELKGFKRIGFRLVRRVVVTETAEELSPFEIARLSTADLLRVDLATIVRGLDRLRPDPPGEQQLSLIVPSSFTSLSSTNGRAQLVEQLKTASQFVRFGVICEIADIEGVPPGALVAATALVRPFSLLVVGHLLDPAPRQIARLAGCGLQALSFERPARLDADEFLNWAPSAIRAARQVSKSVLVYRVSPSDAARLAALGASHATLSST
jgi:hypothetical protein